MKSINVKSLLEEKLVVGAKVRYGVRFAQKHFCNAGDVITLVQGYFERENGLYTETERCPAEWDNETKEFSSIYHIWGNDLEDFMDCEILEEEYAQQSQPSGMRWVREKPANDREFVLVTASLINGEWHYHGWEIIEVPDGYFALCELHGEEWGPYEDLSAEYYLVLSPVSESSPAGAAEGIKCKCPDNIKHGQTSVMCCNHCGLPDEDFWNNCG